MSASGRRIALGARGAAVVAVSILFLFVTMHLLNHALGVFGVAVMEAVQAPRVAMWQSPPGTILLYGALAGPYRADASKRVVRRRFARLPRDEAVQIVLGILIPYLLLEHVVGTRVQSLLGYGAGLRAGAAAHLELRGPQADHPRDRRLGPWLHRHHPGLPGQGASTYAGATPGSSSPPWSRFSPSTASCRRRARWRRGRRPSSS